MIEVRTCFATHTKMFLSVEYYLPVPTVLNEQQLNLLHFSLVLSLRKWSLYLIAKQYIANEG